MMVLLIAVALNPVPTIVTLDPTVPLEGVMLEIVTVLPPLSWWGKHNHGVELRVVVRGGR